MAYNQYNDLPPLVQDPSRSEWPSTPFRPAGSTLQFPPSPTIPPPLGNSAWGGYGAPAEHAAWGGAQADAWGQPQQSQPWGQPQPQPQPEPWPPTAGGASAFDPFNAQGRPATTQPTSWGDPSSSGPSAWNQPQQPTPYHYGQHSLPTTPANLFPGAGSDLRDEFGNIRPVAQGGGYGEGMGMGTGAMGVWGPVSGGTYEPRTDESSFNGGMQLWASPAPTSASWPSPGGDDLTLGLRRPSSRQAQALGRAASMHSSVSSQSQRLFDRPGSWRPDFKTPRTGLDAIIQRKKGKPWTQGSSY